MSKTALALKLVLHGGLSSYAAAKQLKMNESVVYRAHKLAAERGVCPECGRINPTKKTEEKK